MKPTFLIMVTGPHGSVASSSGYETGGPGFDSQLVPWVFFPKGESPQNSPGFEPALREQQCSLYLAVPPSSPLRSYVSMRTTVKHHVAGTVKCTVLAMAERYKIDGKSPSLKMGNYTLQVEVDEVGAEYEKIAREELRETPDVVPDAVTKLRELLKGEKRLFESPALFGPADKGFSLISWSISPVVGEVEV
uniref:Uncharacterized protein n=1 Tax=Timema douglasi TaxID=61478 RepID=A0A7R8VUF2_TIMDO|nr:unnamed protein product [Timema douglasi]